MNSVIFSVNQLLGLGTILAQIFVVTALVYYLFLRKTYPAVHQFLAKYGLVLAFVFALVAMSGSLFYSQYAGYTPCELCWFQRICMYPLVILLGLALIKKFHGIAPYGIALVVIGFLISLYQNYISYVGTSSACPIGGAVSCTKRYILAFNYITIPMMALTAFALVLVFLAATLLKEKVS